MADPRIIIVGGGAAGLSAAGALKRRGLDALVLDARPRVGDVWAERYDRLHLHTVYSSLAHLPLPRGLPKYPSKDDYAAYLRAYARHFDLQIVTGCAVQHIRPAGAASAPEWDVESSCGTWRSPVVIVATGQYHEPVIPPWAGREAFSGTLIHSSAYRNGAPFAGQRVLVVGIGNSGAEIATDLAEHGAQVAISVRTPPPIVPRDAFGMPAQRSSLLLSRLPPRAADAIARTLSRLALGDLTRHGLPQPAWWPYSAGQVPVLDVGFAAALQRGAIAVRPGVARLSTHGVEFADGRAEPFDALVAATGFRSGLERLIDLPGALDDRGDPRFASGEPSAYPGLFFMGFTHSLLGHLREANHDSRRLARTIERYLAG